MSKVKINTSIYERCLLTEVSPYETPLLFSNWGSFNYFRNLIKKNVPSDLRNIFENAKSTIPLNYLYYKDSTKRRMLSIVHPSMSRRIIDLYKKYELLMLRLTQKSSYTIRYPHSVAKFFNLPGEKIKQKTFKAVEQLDENQPFASSYFSYLHYSHLHKYFESEAFTEIEKNFRFQKHMDISKCFTSIYTHSISWATRGKNEAKERKNEVKKDQSFDRLFDVLMQYANFQETNGIIIGPELSRIFAEIILQEVDKNVEKRMTELKYRHEKDYHCCRYIDDYYLYYNSTDIDDNFTSILNDELEFYKLYLNHEKIEFKNRPFISDISIKKLAISDYINHLAETLQKTDKPKFQSQKEINKIRKILNPNPENNHAITNFFITAILNRIFVVNELDRKYSIQAIKMFIDIVFYCIRIDTRVSSIFKLAKVVAVISGIIKRYKKHERITILDKLYYEICETIWAAINNDASVEVMNLLIAEAELGNDYLIEQDLLELIIVNCRKNNENPERNDNILSYFEITTLLFYMKNHTAYKVQKDKVLHDAKILLKQYSAIQFSETAHLLLDLVSSPYIDKDLKIEFVDIAFNTIGSNNTGNKQQIQRFINFVKNESWFFNWGQNVDLRKLLKKKEYMLSY